MRRYILRRALQAFATLILASLVIFALARIAPGDPASLMLGEEASAESIAALRTQLGLDRPLPIQYLTWLSEAVRLDLGESFRFRQPVTSVIANAFLPSLTLVVASMFVGVFLGVTLGSLAGLKPGGRIDLLITGATGMALGIPSFWLGIMAILAFSLWLGWLPPGGWESPFRDFTMSLKLLAMPAITLGLALASQLARFTRASVVETLASPFITTARAKGLSERRTVTRHALRNAFIPILTILGIQFAVVLSGVVVIETVFAIPGWGRLALGAINARDFPLIQGILLLGVLLFVAVNLVVDLLYGVVDPRVRLGVAHARR